ncbi:MAG: SufE family protein [Rickettsiales bacterium]|jgi:cysteine desulfuration protein SufE|nr:SufE family protein [Rickettsiales bacterium]
MTLQELYDGFAALPDWDEKFAYLAELGQALPSFPAELKTEENRVVGCASSVWISAREEGGRRRFLFESDAKIVRGLLYILYLIFDNKTDAEIVAADAMDVFERIGLASALSANRMVGISSAIAKIQGKPRT